MTTKKKNIRKSKDYNFFDLGGNWKTMNTSQKAGAIGSAVGGISSLVGQGINNLNVPQVQNQAITASTNEELMAQMQNYTPVEIQKTNTGGSALSGAASGASAGAALGPWGAAIGGVVGGLAGGLTSIFGNNKKKEREQLLKNQQTQAFNTQVDTIGQNNFNNSLAQSLACGGKLYDQGGNLYSNLPNQATHGGEFGNGGIEINSGGIHEQNPFGGVPMGMGQNGKPNLVEEGEYKFKDYIFSNRLKVDKTNTFAEMAKKNAKESSERPNDPISKNGLKDSMGKLQQAQEILKQAQGVKEGNSFWPGGGVNKMDGLSGTSFLKINRDPNNPALNNFLGINNSYTKDPAANIPNIQAQLASIKTNNNPFYQQNQSNGLSQDNLLRYTPLAASGLASLTDVLGVTNKPDYSAVKDLQGLDNLSVSGQKLGDYVNYKPLDTNYLTNQLGANAASTRSSMRNLSGGNRATYMAGLLGADASYNQGLGQLGRQAAEYNQSQKMQAADFNRGTNQFNAQQSNWEQGINTQMKADSIKTKAQLKAAARQESRGAKMNNLNTFVEGLGDLGKEKIDKNMIAYLASLGLFGTIPTKKAMGGKLNTKKK